MARASRLLAFGALAVSLCVVLLSSSGLEAKVPAPAQTSVQENLANAVALLVLSFIQAASALLPGLIVAFGISTLYSQRDRLSGKVRGGLVLLLLLGVAVLVTSRNLAAGEAPAQEQRTGGGAAKGAVLVKPHSGEETLMSDGTFARLADPSKTDGSLAEDWRQNLANALVQAIANGQEQVVIMFTRQGCPWCDRQLPVLQEAIRRRAATAGAGAAAAGVAFVGGGGGGGSGLLSAPLRVFILDAEEFPNLVRQFGVEAFPTSLVFGRPRVTPLLGRGFLDEETFDAVCREAALAEPEPEEGAPQRKRKGGRRLFR